MQRPIEHPRHRTRRRARQRARSRLRFRVRRIVALVVLLLSADVILSLAGALAAPSNTPAGVQFVEWLRNNGAAGLVSSIEGIYYSLDAPATGGPALTRLPHLGTAAVRGAGAATGGSTSQQSSHRPPPIAPVISPALPGEGIWQGTGLTVGGAPPVLVTAFRPDPEYPRTVAGVAWIDRSRTDVQLYPGRYEPPDSGAVQAQVPPSLRGQLVATFNSGFKLEDGHGGFVAAGHEYAPLREGQATLVRYRDGSLNVRTWTGSPHPGPDVEFARQNLPLILEGGRLNPSLSNDSVWGLTLGNAVRVWRSAVGVDARGNLIYAAAALQTAQSLARIMQRAGAVRAMELDINYEWTTFNFYGTWDAGQGQKLLPGMSRSADRYLSPDDRDFFAVYARSGG